MFFTRWLNKISAIKTAIAIDILLAIAFISPAMAEEDAPFTSDFAGLNEEQQVLAARSLEFLSRMNNMYFDRIDKMNGGSEIQTRAMSTEYADYDVQAARGSVIEKGGRNYSITKKPTRDFQKADSLEPILFRQHACEDPVGRYGS